MKATPEYKEQLELRKQEVDNALEASGLAPYITHGPNQYVSGGQVQVTVKLTFGQKVDVNFYFDFDGTTGIRWGTTGERGAKEAQTVLNLYQRAVEAALYYEARIQGMNEALPLSEVKRYEEVAEGTDDNS